jgi:hypothetical protein
MLAALLHRPTAAGLAVPWVTIFAADGRHLFGAVDATKHDMALHMRLCQICEPLHDLAVFAMRVGDMARMLSPESGMHPWCGWYSGRACPMLAGAMTHYRASSQMPKLPDGMTMHAFGDPTGSRPAAKADTYFQVWAKHFRPVVDPVTRRWAALVVPDWIVRIRQGRRTSGAAPSGGGPAPAGTPPDLQPADRMALAALSRLLPGHSGLRSSSPPPRRCAGRYGGGSLKSERPLSTSWPIFLHLHSCIFWCGV